MKLVVNDQFAISLNNPNDFSNAESIFKRLNLEYSTGYKFKIGVKPQTVETTIPDEYSLRVLFLFRRFEYLVLDSHIIDDEVIVTIGQVKNEEN